MKKLTTEGKGIKQWDLKNNSIVELPDGSRVTFLKMDGMYAHWDKNGKQKIGNFKDFEKTNFGYKVKINNE